MNPLPPLTRKDIVQLLGGKVSIWQLRRHEKDWGLDKARMKLKTRTVLYRRSVAVLVLKDFGVEI